MTTPWDAPAIRTWVAHGFRCALMAGPWDGAVNGYVRAPGITPEQTAQIEVHGGVTYERDGWVGFDTLHSGDVWPNAEHPLPATPWDIHWTEDLVAKETERLAAQVKAVLEQ